MVIEIPNNEFEEGRELNPFIPPRPIEEKEKYQPVGISLKRPSLKIKEDFILSGSLRAEAYDRSVSNTTNATVLEVYRFEKFAFYPGMTLRIYAAGAYQKADGVETVQLVIAYFAGRQTVGATISGSPIAAAGITSPAADIVDEQWYAQATTVVRDVGTTGFFDTRMHGSFNGTFDEGVNGENFSDATAMDLAVYAVWTGADAGNTITLRQFILEIVR